MNIKPKLQKINWYQAGAEVLLLFISVGIALIADSWIDYRKDNIDEQEYLESLYIDFTDTKKIFQNALDITRQNNWTSPRSIDISGLFFEHRRKRFGWVRIEDGYEPTGKVTRIYKTPIRLF